MPLATIWPLSLSIPDAHSALQFLLLYIGPDQILPLTSVLGGIVGVLLIMWNRVVGAGRKLLAFCLRKFQAAPKP
jgi:hypothetical protein